MVKGRLMTGPTSASSPLRLGGQPSYGSDPVEVCVFGWFGRGNAFVCEVRERVK